MLTHHSCVVKDKTYWYMCVGLPFSKLTLVSLSSDKLSVAATGDFKIQMKKRSKILLVTQYYGMYRHVYFVTCPPFHSTVSFSLMYIERFKKAVDVLTFCTYTCFGVA